MASPIFPRTEDLLTLLMGELPSGVYADDRADSPDDTQRSYSSSELRAQAQTFADLYANLENIWQNKWVSTINPDGYAPWEFELFAGAQDASLSLSQRKSNLLAQRRAQGSISLPAIASIISGILDPQGLTFDIIPYNGCNSLSGARSAWILDVSALDQFTYLAGIDPLLGAGRDLGIVPLDCSLDYAAAGLTADQLAGIQETAYTYAVLIYGVADAQTLALLDRILTKKEPARSTHVIINNAIPPVVPDDLDAGPFVEDTLLDNVDFGMFTSPPATYDVFDMGGF